MINQMNNNPNGHLDTYPRHGNGEVKLCPKFDFKRIESGNISPTDILKILIKYKRILKLKIMKLRANPYCFRK